MIVGLKASIIGFVIEIINIYFFETLISKYKEDFKR